MISVLHILTYINGGGAEAVVYNYYSHIDRSKIKFDIVVLKSPNEQLLSMKFKKLGADIYYISKNPIKRIFEIDKIISHGKYDIVHSHCEFLSEIYLGVAYIHGIKVRILHSHIANPKMPLIKRLYRPISKFIARQTATSFFACGEKAAISMWGQRAFDAGKCYIVRNALPLEDYLFSREKREGVRIKMSWEDKHVIVNVGRLNYQKNHGFLLDIFEQCITTDEKAILVLIGDGELEYKLRCLIADHKLESKVELLGVRNDVPELLNACDCFVLPSLFEGLPVVAIESQANGLPVIMSDTITKECDISDVVKYIPLSCKDEWVSSIISAMSKKLNRAKYNEIVSKAGYDINDEAPKLLKKYIDLVNSHCDVN